MLAISSATSPRRRGRWIVTVLALLMIGGGAYGAALLFSPAIAPALTMKPIDLKTLPQPAVGTNRIIIAPIGVNIPYGKGQAALDAGAEWRVPDRGNPETGGNFVIAAHRFSIQPTPQSTIEKSPFYNIDKLKVEDPIVVDYNGKRYGYKVSEVFTVKPTETSIEDSSTKPMLTLYTCELGGAESGRVVIRANPMGEVAIR